MDKIRDYLYISDIDGTEEEYVPEDVDFIVNLSGKHAYVSDIWYPLKDGAMNEDRREGMRFFGAVQNVIDAIEEGDTVLVHCAMGVSRSGSVCATVLAYVEDMEYEEALEEVKEARTIVNPQEVLNSYGKKFLERKENM